MIKNEKYESVIRHWKPQACTMSLVGIYHNSAYHLPNLRRCMTQVPNSFSLPAWACMKHKIKMKTEVLCGELPSNELHSLVHARVLVQNVEPLDRSGMS